MQRQQPLRVLQLFVALAFVALSNAIPTIAQERSGAQSQYKGSLYERIGGYDAIAAMMSNFVERMTTDPDPEFSRYFVGFDTAHRNRFRQTFVEWACEGLGGPCYSGVDMTAKHQGLNLTSQHWQHARELLKESINGLKIPESEKAEVLRVLSKFEGATTATAAVKAAGGTCEQ